MVAEKTGECRLERSHFECSATVRGQGLDLNQGLAELALGLQKPRDGQSGPVMGWLEQDGAAQQEQRLSRLALFNRQVGQQQHRLDIGGSDRQPLHQETLGVRRVTGPYCHARLFEDEICALVRWDRRSLIADHLISPGQWTPPPRSFTTNM